MLYYAILYYIILYYTILYYTILYYTILYYTILYYAILYYTTILIYHPEHTPPLPYCMSASPPPLSQAGARHPLAAWQREYLAGMRQLLQRLPVPPALHGVSPVSTEIIF